MPTTVVRRFALALTNCDDHGDGDEQNAMIKRYEFNLVLSKIIWRIE